METRSETLKKRLDMGGGDELDSKQEMSDNIPLSPQTNDVTIGKWKFNKVILSTHFNIFLYATCFWIQIGTLPVSLA